jgi:four helix bundle protein
MHNFKELKVWQESMKLAKEVFTVTKEFPIEEKFGLTSQIRRAIISIPSNIAEGTSRSSDKEFSRFLEIGLGSSFELETQLILSSDFEYLSQAHSSDLITSVNNVQRMLFGLKNKIKNNF